MDTRNPIRWFNIFKPKDNQSNEQSITDNAEQLIQDLQYLFGELARVCNIPVSVALYIDMVCGGGKLTKFKLEKECREGLAMVQAVNGLSDDDLDEYSKALNFFEQVLKVTSLLNTHGLVDCFTVVDGRIVICGEGMKPPKMEFLELISHYKY